MMKNKHYANGQKTYAFVGDKLTYFFKDGKVKAEGVTINNLMQGEWRFYRESAQLWQVGHFKDDKKHGRWIRYNKQGNIEYDETFENGKKGLRKP